MMRRREILCCVVLLVAAISCFPQEVLSSHHQHHHHYSEREIRKEFYKWVKSKGHKSHGTDSLIDPQRSNISNTDSLQSQLGKKDSSQSIVVDKNGKGDFTTVQGAVNSIKSGNSVRVTIQINAGTYKEKVKIPTGKNYITFQGAGMDVTKITWYLTAGKAGSTLNSASVAVNGDHFIARDISFENTAPSPPPGAVKKQAVALQVSGDKAAFYRCGFYGYQDTLYDRKGRHYFKDCYIRGTIDFIFGDGQSLYDGCYLNPVASTFGSLSAQKRSSSKSPTGYSFLNCEVRGTGSLYLSRAWGAYSRVVFIYTYLADIIREGGWNDFGVPSRQKTVYYGEYKCTGPGANRQDRVKWSFELTEAQAAPFMTIDWIDGQSWLPSSS